MDNDATSFASLDNTNEESPTKIDQDDKLVSSSTPTIPQSIPPSKTPATTNSRRVGKTEKKGRFTITDLDPDSPEVSNRKGLLPQSLPPRLTSLSDDDFSMDDHDDEDDNTKTQQTEEPKVVVTRSRRSSKAALPAAASSSVSQAAKPVADEEKATNESKADAEALQRLMTVLAEEQAKTLKLVSAMVTTPKASPTTSSVYHPPKEPSGNDHHDFSAKATGVYKGKHESLYYLLQQIQSQLDESSKRNDALERQNEMLEARLDQECRANTALREQMDILTQYTESLFSEDYFDSLSPEGIAAAAASSDEKAKSKVSLLNTPPASFRPLSPKKDRILDSFQPKCAAVQLPSTECSVDKEEQQQNHHDPPAVQVVTSSASTLDKMLFSQADNLSQKLGVSTIATPTSSTAAAQLKSPGPSSSGFKPPCTQPTAPSGPLLSALGSSTSSNLAAPGPGGWVQSGMNQGPSVGTNAMTTHPVMLSSSSSGVMRSGSSTIMNTSGGGPILSTSSLPIQPSGSTMNPMMAGNTSMMSSSSSASSLGMNSSNPMMYQPQATPPLSRMGSSNMPGPPPPPLISQRSLGAAQMMPPPPQPPMVRRPSGGTENSLL